MAEQTRELGDSHNFGRRVSLRDGRIYKPRTVFWEWLLLSAASPLRRKLDDIAASDDSGVRFDFLPSLQFTPSPTGSPSRPEAAGAQRATAALPAELEGEIERVQLGPLRLASPEDQHRLAAVTGRAVALFSWLGLGDLHWENMMLGSGPQGQIVFAPLDIELMLDDHALPTATRLLPEADPDYGVLYQHACGIRRVLPFLGKPVPIATLLTIAAAYCQTLALLDRGAREIAATLSSLPQVQTAPLRVCLRSTGDYLHPVDDLQPPALAAELQQLRRGDIPYFFRLYGRPGIQYFADATLSTSQRLPTRGDVPQLAPLLSLSKGLRSPGRRSLQEQGLFCLLGAFDHPTFQGTHTGSDIVVRFSARQLSVRLPNGDELDTRRDLRRFVSSVYLPCRCGEVHSALVPHVTRCVSSASPRSGASIPHTHPADPLR